MTLGIILASGDSFVNMAKSGQDELFKNYYLKKFSEKFDKIYVFSYASEQINDLPKNVYVISNDFRIHRYFYNFLMPIINQSYFRKVDVIRTYHLFGILPAVVAKIFLGKKFVFNFAYDYFAFAKILKQNYQIIFLPFLLSLSKFASKIFVARKDYVRLLPKGKTIFLPNGVDTEFFKPKKTIKRKKIILSVGRLTRQKNFKALIQAMKDVEGVLVIVGQGDQASLIKIAEENNISLELVGSVPHNKMPKYYNEAEIFVSTSIIEGHPKTLLEAMSSGLPIIATNVEGNNSLIKHKINGLLCGTSAKSIHASIAQLMRNKKQGQILGKRARLEIIEHYDLNRLLEKEVEILNQVARSK